MVSLRSQPESDSRARFNVLLAEERLGQQVSWLEQLSCLLQPQGVASFIARSGQEAVNLAEQREIHAAVIDLATPFSVGQENAPPRGPAGWWLLELMRRMPNHPPVVILYKPAPAHHQVERILRDALRLGAFSVMNKPVDIEQLLAVFRRLVDRRYRGQWPDAPPSP